MSLFPRPAKVRLLELRNTYKWGGGPDKTILLSAEQHDRSRVEVVVVYIRDVRDREFTIGDKARAKGLTFYEIEERGRLDFRVLCALKEIVIRHNINIIHAHDYKSDLFAYMLGWRLRKRPVALISTMHGWALGGTRGRIYQCLDLLLLRRFDHVIAVSEATKSEMIRGGVPADLITVIHNGIDVRMWSPEGVKSSVRASLGLGDECPVIGYVGRISPEKDLSRWLRVAASLAREYPVAQFVIVGEGRSSQVLDELKNLASTLGISRNVHFLGYRNDLRSLYMSFDVFLLSSTTEGICNSLLEAMALGIPVVATAVGGTQEVVIDGENGFIVPARDIAGMTRQIANLISKACLRKRIGRMAQTRVRDHFSFDSRLRRIETLYENVLLGLTSL